MPTRFFLRYSLLLPLCLFAFLLTACDSVGTTASTASASTGGDDVAAALAQELALSPNAASDLRTRLARLDEGKGAPGYLWHAAAALQEHLTTEQKESLFARLEQRSEGRFDHQRPGTFRHRRNALENLLDLTEEQQTAVAAIREEYAPKLRELMQARRDGTLSSDDFRTQAKALRDAMQGEISALLTEEQRAQLEAARGAWEDRRETRRERRQDQRERRKERGEQVQAARVEVLGLSEAQEQALAELRDAHQAQMKALREQARGSEKDPAVLRGELSELRTAHAEEAASILTEKQLEIVKLHRFLVQHMPHGQNKSTG